MTVPAPAEPALSVERLTFSYGDGRTALDDMTLTVASGERVALIGPNGAGKSTLLLHLNGLLRGSGRIRIGGLEIGRAPMREIRRRVGLVFQDPDDQLFMPTCLEDVAFGPLNLGQTWEDARAHAMEALASVGMVEHADREPHRLSLGQRKRVAIATVLSMEPEILALDEPSAGLDPRARRQLMELLQGLPQTCLMATHDMAMAAELCPRAVVLDAGRVVADGPTHAILSDTGLLTAHGL
jgi:cobalt/nickel transport system ATP-binding protein